MHTRVVLLSCLASAVVSLLIVLVFGAHTTAVGSQAQSQITAESITIVDENGTPKITLACEDGCPVIRLVGDEDNRIQLAIDPEGESGLILSGTTARLILDEPGGYYAMITADDAGGGFSINNLFSMESLSLDLHKNSGALSLETAGSRRIALCILDEILMQQMETGFGEDDQSYTLMLSPPGSSIYLTNGEQDSIDLMTSGIHTGIQLENGPDYTSLYVVDSERERGMNEQIGDPGNDQYITRTPPIESGTENHSFRVYVHTPVVEETDVKARLAELGIEVLDSFPDPSGDDEVMLYLVGEFDTYDKAREFESGLKDTGLDTFCTRSR